MPFHRDKVAEVDAPTAAAWVKSGDAVLVDVREDDEVANAAVATAKLLPMSHVGVDAYPDFGAKKVVVMCHSGARSARVTAALAARGVEAFNLKGGIVAWIQAGLPVNRGR